MSKIFEEGQEAFIWAFNPSTNQENLQIATIYSCEKCQKPATVNAVWVLSGYQADFFRAKNQADTLKKEYGPLTELCSTEDGDSFCEACYYKQSSNVG